MTQVCIIGDGAVALAVADVISKGRAPDGDVLEARIVCESLPQGMSCDQEYTGGHKHPDLQGYLHSAVGKVKGLRHTLRQAKQQEASSALSLMSGLEAAATGLTHIDQREVLTRENIHIESLNTFEREAASEVLQAFIFTCPATAYGAYLERIALAINDGCAIVLLGAPPFAALEVKHKLSTLRPGVQVDVIEVDEIFASVEERDGNIHMVSPARRVNVAGATLNETRRAMWLPALLCREIIPASNMVERALLDAHSILRPGFLMAALLGGRMDSSLSDVSRLLNRANLSMFVEIEQELSRVASVAHCQPVDLARSLREEIDVKSMPQGPVCDATLAEAIVTIAGKWFSAPVRNWSYNRAQDALCLYVSDYLVPLSQLGDSLDVDTPVIDSLISMASAVTGQDLRANGRRFATIGLDGIKGQDLLELMEN